MVYAFRYAFIIQLCVKIWSFRASLIAAHGDISVGVQLVKFHLENVVLQYSLCPDSGAASLALNLQRHAAL